METVLHQYLPHLSTNHGINIEVVLRGNEVQLNWTILATGLNEEDSLDLHCSPMGYYYRIFTHSSRTVEGSA